MALTKIDDRGLTTPIDLLDNEKIRFGTGNDVEIFHDGSGSQINNSTSYLVIQSDDLRLRDKASGHPYLKGVVDGAVELYYDGTLKCSTYGDGLNFPDLGTLAFGASNDMKLYHYNNENYIVSNGTLKVQSNYVYINDEDGNNFIRCEDGSYVSLHHNGNKKLNTVANGIQVRGAEGAAGEFYLYADEGDDNADLWLLKADYVASGFYIQNKNSGSWEDSIRCFGDGAVELFYDNVKTFETISTGAAVHGSTGDVARLRIIGKEGRSSELQLWADDGDDFTDICRVHQSTNGNLYIQNNTASSTWENLIVATPNAAVELFYDGVKRFTTLNYGAIVYGSCEVSANTANSYAAQTINDGDSTSRYGHLIRCGADDAAGTNYALGVADGDGSTQGYLTFSGGTLSLVAFTAAHPCIIPDADNPSDDSMAYPYGTLLETISIEYSQKNGADTERGIRYKVQKTQSANSRKVLGAYAGSMNGGPDGQTNEHDVYVLGDGHILVNNAGGNIEVGDGICSSATAGIGQKATANPSMIIGIAQEAVTFTGSETKLVAVQYGLQQFIPWT